MLKYVRPRHGRGIASGSCRKAIRHATVGATGILRRDADIRIKSGYALFRALTVDIGLKLFAQEVDLRVINFLDRDERLVWGFKFSGFYDFECFDHTLLSPKNALVSINKGFEDKKELEKIILVKIPAEVYPTLYETFIYLFSQSGVKNINIEKKVDFEKMYNEKAKS